MLHSNCMQFRSGVKIIKHISTLYVDWKNHFKRNINWIQIHFSKLIVSIVEFSFSAFWTPPLERNHSQSVGDKGAAPSDQRTRASNSHCDDLRPLPQWPGTASAGAGAGSGVPSLKWWTWHHSSSTEGGIPAPFTYLSDITTCRGWFSYIHTITVRVRAHTTHWLKDTCAKTKHCIIDCSARPLISHHQFDVSGGKPSKGEATLQGTFAKISSTRKKT